MSLPLAEDVKDDTSMHGSSVGNTTTSPKIESRHKPAPESHGYLSAPLTGPIRPLSPDALSILSADEYDQIQHDQQTYPDLRHPTLVSQRGWRLKVRVFFDKNLGLVYMLMVCQTLVHHSVY